MSVLGYEQTSSHPESTSALPPRADIQIRASAFSSAVSPDAQDGGAVRYPLPRWLLLPMTYNAILIIECLVEDFGWDAVMDVLMKEAATASDAHLNKVEGHLDAAITVNEGKGQLFVL